ncbi:FG-GAP-like repeat-containing protein [Streptomyces sp. NPDC091204]|uniref:C40 family peptidase n=1 Tax=Streptomyces sp. NPDC091204 TaxID=3155299 RepID=UPI00342BEA22
MSSKLRRTSATVLLAAGLASAVLASTVPAHAATADPRPATAQSADQGTITPFTPTVPNPTTATRAELDAARAAAAKKTPFLAAPPSLQSESGVAGSITRSEVIDRAKSWVAAGVPYSMTSYRSDANGRYRTDCSGFVSMAWHLASSSANNYGETTGTLLDFTSSISKESLKPGDILLNPNSGASGHVVIFNGWANAEHTRYDAYEQAGSTGAVHREIPYPYFSGHGTFSPRRYDKIVDAPDGSAGGDLGRVRWADFDGDGKSDYITVESSGAVNVYLNRGGDGHGGWQVLGQVATGLTTDRSRVRFADFDGDGKADYLTIADNGAVTVNLNKGGDGHGGWQNIGQVAAGTTRSAEQVRFADFDGDRKADYLTIADNGAVNVHLNRGGDTAGGWDNQGQVASGLTTDRSRVRFADIDGDGKADYVPINANGSITPYLNRGGDGHGGWNSPGQIASGLTTNQDQVAFADFAGDSKADYLVTKPNNAIEAWINNGGDTGGGWNTLGQIATGA